MELPEVLARAGVVGDDVARDVLDPALVLSVLVRGPHDHDPVDHDRRRGRGRVADLERDPPVGIPGPAQVLPGAPSPRLVLERVDDAGPGEALERDRPPPVLERTAALGIERPEEARRADAEDHAPPVHLRVRDALPVVGAHRVLPPEGVRLAEAPEDRAGPGIDRDDAPAFAGDRVEHPVHIEGRGTRKEGPEALAAPAPLDPEPFEVGGVDLVERGVARVSGVTSDVAPLAPVGAVGGCLAPDRTGMARRERCGEGQGENGGKRGRREAAEP